MKKIMMVLMMAVTMMAGLFAYEPKKECAKVKRNGDVVYHEKTELYNIYGSKPDPEARGWDGCKTSKDYVKWVIRKGYTVEQCVEYEYGLLEHLRNSYRWFLKDAVSQELSKADIAYAKAYNEINGSDIPAENLCARISLELAEYEKRTAIISILFVTEENWLILTKEEMRAKMYAFIEEVKAEKR